MEEHNKQQAKDTRKAFEKQLNQLAYNQQ